MPRPPSVPKLTHHKASGKAVVRLSGVDIYCGTFGSPEAKSAYDRAIAEWLARGRTPDPVRQSGPVAGEPQPGVSVNEVLLAFWRYAERHYRTPEGKPTSQLAEYRQTLRVVRELYGLEPATKFGPLALKAVRQAMVRSGLSRPEVNRRIGLARRVFKWAAGEELIPFDVYHRLTTVAGLQKGRGEAPDAEPVAPVDDVTVDATLPHLGRHVRGLVEFQRLTGCRPGEACLLRRADIDTGGAVWLYKPARHKNAHRGKARVVAIGPKAQALLREFFTPNLDEYLFSPRRAVEEFHVERSARRLTPRYANHMRRNTGKQVTSPKRAPAGRYAASSYGHAVARACDRAFPPSGELAQREGETHAEWWGRLTVAQRAEVVAWRAAHRWHPNQLRHSFATRVRKQHGLEAAQVLLGHARADVTQVYAERNEQLAASVAAKIG
jgi:integrase